MIIEFALIDPKAKPGTPDRPKGINTRLIAEVDPIYEPASNDDTTPVRIGTELTMHNGRKHRVRESFTTVMNRAGSRQ